MDRKTMDKATAAKLREPFQPEEIGKLPRVSCYNCRQAGPSKACPEHTKSRCPACKNFITSAHIHLDYVGHAEITDRLLQADPEWVWEPMAFNADGLPQFDSLGGLWIRLTVAGVTRIGYGHADGKKGADAIKEIIGDALRNASMRFGVALDLWGAKFEAPTDEDTPEQDAMTEEQRERLFDLVKDSGLDRDAGMRFVNEVIAPATVTTTRQLTAVQAKTVIARLESFVSQQQPPADGGPKA